jgi:hypothetical protein
VDITDPAVPAPAGYYDVGGIAWKGAMKGDLFVVPGHSDGVYVFRNENLLPNDVSAETPRAGGTRLTNHPNPFNPQTTLYFLLPEASRVRLAVHDLSGRLLTVLVDDARQAGEHAVDWNGRDSGGRELASGVYLARLETERGVRTQKLVLAR